jgi:hypothetical protein
MLNKFASVARTVGILLAIIAAFVVIPAPIALILVLLGLIAGLAYGPEDFIRLGVLVLVLPMAGAALGNLPTIGQGLAIAFGNVALLVAAALATRIILRLYAVVVGDVMGLAK